MVDLFVCLTLFHIILYASCQLRERMYNCIVLTIFIFPVCRKPLKSFQNHYAFALPKRTSHRIQLIHRIHYIHPDKYSIITPITGLRINARKNDIPNPIFLSFPKNPTRIAQINHKKYNALVLAHSRRFYSYFLFFRFLA